MAYFKYGEKNIYYEEQVPVFHWFCYMGTACLQKCLPESWICTKKILK